jgi:uncharacterized protein (TIGR00251 family)
METSWLRTGEARITLTLHIQPGAKKTEVAGLYGDALKIRLAAPPVDGKANAALIGFIASRLGLAKSAVSLKSGQTSRRKVLEVIAAPADAAQRLLSNVSP